MDYYLKCFYCESDITLPHQREKGILHGTKDHIIPLSKGGSSKGENLVPCCGICNQYKHSHSLKDWIEIIDRQIESNKGWGGHVIYKLKVAQKNAVALLNSGSVAAIPYSIAFIKRMRIEGAIFASKPHGKQIVIHHDRAGGPAYQIDKDFLFLQSQTTEQLRLAKKHGIRIAMALTEQEPNFHAC